MDTEFTDLGSCATLLGVLLMQSPKNGAVADAAKGLCSANLEDEWPYGSEHELKNISLLLEEARDSSPEHLDREFHHLFVGPGNLDAPPWGSVYLDSESVVFGDSCMALTRWMKTNGVTLHEGESREPADQIGRMLVLLGWLCENSPDLIDEYLRLHLMTWAPIYFDRLETAAEGPFYRAIAKLARLTLAEITSRQELP